jgi:predicted peroxiredoxin
MPDQKFDLQILITTGPEAPEKAVLGFAAALSAVHSDISVSVVLAMRGAIWAADCQGVESTVPGYPPVGELIELIQEDGGHILGCSSCIDQYCPAPIGDDGQKVLRKGIELVGLPRVTMRMADPHTQTVNF